jgi:hypothetical protein
LRAGAQFRFLCVEPKAHNTKQAPLHAAAIKKQVNEICEQADKYGVSKPPSASWVSDKQAPEPQERRGIGKQ